MNVTPNEYCMHRKKNLLKGSQSCKQTKQKLINVKRKILLEIFISLV